MKRFREVRALHLVTYLLFPAIFLVAIVAANVMLPRFVSGTVIRIVALAVSAVIGYFPLKRFAIGAVLAYKAFAPMSVRNQCRFEPSCSSYMIMAINKYGLFVGVYKGIRRILRCKPPNGGVDYP